MQTTQVVYNWRYKMFIIRTINDLNQNQNGLPSVETNEKLELLTRLCRMSLMLSGNFNYILIFAALMFLQIGVLI